MGGYLLLLLDGIKGRLAHFRHQPHNFSFRAAHPITTRPRRGFVEAVPDDDLFLLTNLVLVLILLIVELIDCVVGRLLAVVRSLRAAGVAKPRAEVGALLPAAIPYFIGVVKVRRSRMVETGF